MVSYLGFDPLFRTISLADGSSSRILCRPHGCGINSWDFEGGLAVTGGDDGAVSVVETHGWLGLNLAPFEKLELVGNILIHIFIFQRLGYGKKLVGNSKAAMRTLKKRASKRTPT